MMLETMEIIYKIIICAFVFIFGTLIGSFMNVVVYRSERSESVVKVRSHCPKCMTQIKNRDLIPVFSWLFLGGRCRSCKEKISPQYPIVEALTGIYYVLSFLNFGIGHEFIISMLLFPILVFLSIVDFKKTEIPYWCSISVGVLGLAAFIISFGSNSQSIWYEHIIGAFIISVPFAIFAYLGAMGGGDVQLVFAAGLLLGWAIVPAVLIAFIAGAIFGIVIKLTKKLSKMCFGPFLALGIAVSYLYGHSIIEAYLQSLR